MSAGTRPMPSPGAVKPPATREELPYINGRLTVFWVCFVALMAALIMRVYFLTVLKGPEMRESTEKNFLIDSALLPPRGRILDRNGFPLAVNKIVYDIDMSPFQLTREQIADSVAKVSTLLGRPGIAARAQDVVRLRPRWKSQTLARGLGLDEALPVLEQSFLLPGIIVNKRYEREYPAGVVAGHLTGHLGGIALRRLEEYTARGYLPFENVGKLGAELGFEDDLHGEPGVEMVTRDARGRPRGSFVDRQAAPGDDVILNIDYRLQKLADALLEGWEGSIIAMDPRNGEVLAMAEHPNYDPSHPLRTLQDGRKFSSFNKSIMGGQFAPGSSFKIVTAAAGLLQGRSPLEVEDCDGAYHLAGAARFPCHLHEGHGGQNLYDALQHSCNVYFYHWAHMVGAKAMAEAAASFGFGEPTGIDILPPGMERGGILAKPGIDRIYLGSVLHMGIGQGELIGVTPMQVARAYAALCNGGSLLQPRVLREVRTPGGELARASEPAEESKLPLSEAQRGEILEGLKRVTYRRPKDVMRGTAALVGFKPEWRVAGKTGTAQNGRPIPDAWFCCYAPWESPRILIVALVEDAGHGGVVAAPLARQMLAQYFGEPEAAIVPPPKNVALTGGD